MTIREYKRLSLPDRKKFWKAHPISGNTSIVIPGIPAFDMFSTNDDVVIKELYWTKFKGWEYTSLLLWHFLNQRLTGAVLDIGSYSGIYALIAAQNAKNFVHAFDIQKVCVERVEKNIRINQFSNVFTYHMGLSDEEKEAIYHYNYEENFLTSIASLKKRKSHDSTASIPLVKGDSIVDRIANSQSIHNIKIDVEDLEQNTIRGLKETILKHKPNLLVEILNIRDVKAVARLLPDEYICFRINENRRSILPFRKWLPNWPIGRNYLFTIQEGIINDFYSHLEKNKLRS